jgi:Ubiquitin elongating factor core
VRWLLSSLQLNIEAEKDRPSPLLSSSAGFTGNLSAVFLSLCQPIVSDHSKIKKVDWRFLTAHTQTSPLLVPGGDTDIFPRDCTRLTPSAVFPAHAAHREDEEAPPTEFNFITLVSYHINTAQRASTSLRVKTPYH